MIARLMRNESTLTLSFHFSIFLCNLHIGPSKIKVLQGSPEWIEFNGLEKSNTQIYPEQTYLPKLLAGYLPNNLHTFRRKFTADWKKL